jgi:hypothetical protein
MFLFRGVTNVKPASLIFLSLCGTVALAIQVPSNAFAQSEMLAPAAVELSVHASVSAVQCRDAVSEKPVEQVVLSKVPRTQEQISFDAKSLLDRLYEIARNPETPSVSLQAHDELIKQYEPFRIASEKFIVSRGSPENLDLVRGLALMRTSSVTLRKKIKTMEALLSPTIWQRVSNVSAYSAKGKDKKINATADEIQTCRSNIQTCLADSKRLIGGREKELSEIKTVLIKVDEELSVLGKVGEEIANNSAVLPTSVRNELSDVITTQIRNFEIARAVMQSTQQSLEAEVHVALQLIDGTGDLIHHQIQLLAVAGAPERILQTTARSIPIGAAIPGTADPINSKLRNILDGGGIDPQTKVLTLVDFLDAHTINDQELLYILESTPHSIARGWNGFNGFAGAMTNEGLGSWNLDDNWGGADLVIVWKALSQVSHRTLPNSALTNVPVMAKKLIKDSKTWTNMSYRSDFRKQVDIFVDKLFLKVLNKGE